jgi:septum formation topological specificity factor MinE
MIYSYENQIEVKNRAKSLMNINREKFTHTKMTELLNEVVDRYIESIPSQVSIKLPKLKSINSSTEKPKIKLPKLKKVTSEGASA